MTVTLCTSNQAIHLAGAGASSTVVASTALVEEFINEVEGEIVGATKINYVGDYASINTYVKELLRACCAAGAAKKIAVYDRSNYFSAQEHEILVDVLHDQFLRNLADLKNLDTNKIRSVQT